MSIFAKIVLAALLVTLLVVAGAAMVSLYRPTPVPLAEVIAPTTPPAPTPAPGPADEANPFEASVVNPFEDETYSNPFAAETSTPEEEYVNPFGEL